MLFRSGGPLGGVVLPVGMDYEEEGYLHPPVGVAGVTLLGDLLGGPTRGTRRGFLGGVWGVHRENHHLPFRGYQVSPLQRLLEGGPS